MRQTALALCLLAGFAVGAEAQTCPPPEDVVAGAEPPLAAVRYLADDRLEGRRAGSDGERCAAEFIAGEFARSGLRPAGTDGFFQTVPLVAILNPLAAGDTGRNVVAALDGGDPTLAREWIVIGAHYDHLGHGGPGSLGRGRAIHNGADDNASGVAAMLRAAERLAAGPKPARSVLFIAFTGEEAGLLGSAHFVANPTIDGTMVAMINLDMVGRLGGRPVVTYGVDTAEEWRSIVGPLADRLGLSLTYRGEGYGPSDHMSFYRADIPVLHFFTNMHADYHRPTDDWQAIDVDGLEKISTLVVDVTMDIANRRPQAVTLRRGAGTPPVQRARMKPGSAYLGTAPDFAPVPRGVRVREISPNSPAARAGLQADDVIVGLGTHEVTDLEGLTDALGAHKPGQTVPLRVLRDGKELTLTVTLGARP